MTAPADRPLVDVDFPRSFRGYERDAVDRFVMQAMEELERLARANRELSARLADAEKGSAEHTRLLTEIQRDLRLALRRWPSLRDRLT